MGEDDTGNSIYFESEFPFGNGTEDWKEFYAKENGNGVHVPALEDKMVYATYCHIFVDIFLDLYRVFFNNFFNFEVELRSSFLLTDSSSMHLLALFLSYRPCE